MVQYKIKRTAQGILTFFVVLTITFVMYRMLPGGPVDQAVARALEQCAQSGREVCNVELIRERVERKINIDPDKPIPTAYVEYVRDVVLHQDFGESTLYSQEPFDILFQAMPWSVFISLYGLIFGQLINIFIGAAMAYNEGSRFDSGTTIFAMVGNAIPYYVAAIFALAFLAYELNIFPTGGRAAQSMALVIPGIGQVASWENIEPGYNLPYMLGVVWHATLPVFTGIVLGINGLGMRANSIRVLGSDYLRVARLRGLSQVRIATRYVARNAILPKYTSFMIGIAAIFGSGIIMERIFTYPAVGWYTFNALTQRDYPLLMASFMFYTAITILGILIAEFTYEYIDPRATAGDAQ